MVIDIRLLARKQLKEIYIYHKNVAGIRVAKRITGQILQAIDKLGRSPGLGTVIPDHNKKQYTFRSFVAHSNYRIIYYCDETTIYIFAIWDTRQHPDKKKKLLSAPD